MLDANTGRKKGRENNDVRYGNKGERERNEIGGGKKRDIYIERENRKKKCFWFRLSNE